MVYCCHQCGLDLCSRCFHGYVHPFHTHKLRRAQPELVYQTTEGQWRCDACHVVYTPDSTTSLYHCSKCEVDLCDTCYSGQLRHSLHPQHPLTPVDPCILYRLHLSWSCDNCQQTFNSTTDTVFYHCPLCEYDLCNNCFHGRKHHLHPHRLTPLTQSPPTTHPCSHCHTQPSAHKCTQESCDFTLCVACYKTTPRPHPLHAHPLELCDARVVYPQSGGLWHCDNCTRANPGGYQTPLSPDEPMYHCDECEFDLCEPCYKSRPQTKNYEALNRLFPTQQGSWAQPVSYEQLKPTSYEHVQPASYEPHRQNTEQTSTGDQRMRRQPMSYELGTYDPRPPATTAMLCLVCARRPATHTFLHGRGRCTLVAIVCEGCSEDVLLDRRLCPYCKEVPDQADKLY